MCAFTNLLISLLKSTTADDFNKVVVGIAALVGLVVSPVLQWCIAKRQAADNISAKRQIWIDELRKEVAEYLTLFARLEELRRPASNLSSEDKKANFTDRMDANKRAMELGIRIQLRLNPKEADHNTFMCLLRALSDACKDPPTNETDEQKEAAQKQFSEARDKVTEHVQSILKHEWERVKRGDM